jgi:putative tryptophan/tyrosine transport system substrate-binding protein
MKLKTAHNLAIIFALAWLFLPQPCSGRGGGTEESFAGRCPGYRFGFLRRARLFPADSARTWIIEGHIAIEYRSAEGKNARQPELARELVNMNVNVLVSGGGNDVTRALMQATKTIPIVMTAASDAVARGLISSLARPAGNVTGLTSLWDDLIGKRLELLKDTIPKLSRVAVLWHSSGGRKTQWKASQAAAQPLNLQLHSKEIHSAEDLENVFKEAAKARSGAVAVTQSSEVGSNPQRVINLASKHRLPAIYAIPEYAESGGLMAYGTNRADLYSRAALYVDKILKGGHGRRTPRRAADKV